MSCGGSGYILVPQCCYRPNPDGSCCGNPEPGQEPCDGCSGCMPGPREDSLGAERSRGAGSVLGDAAAAEPGRIADPCRLPPVL